jgi:hypothetical protein
MNQRSGYTHPIAFGFSVSLVVLAEQSHWSEPEARSWAYGASLWLVRLLRGQCSWLASGRSVRSFGVTFFPQSQHRSTPFLHDL